MDDLPHRRPDLRAALWAALAAGCPVARLGNASGNPLPEPRPVPDQAVVPPVAQVAPVARTTAHDPIEVAERLAITAEPQLPPPGSAARRTADARQRAALDGLLAAARLRPS